MLGCKNEKQQEKTLLDEVIKIHDKVMADDEVIMKNKAQLDTIAAHATDAGVKDSVARYNGLLNNAEDAMMTWMNKFDPDHMGKTHTEIMNYLNDQKKSILQADSQITTAITSSNNYIKSKGK